MYDPKLSIFEDNMALDTRQLVITSLKIIGAGGLMGVAAVAPNTVMAFEKLGVFDTQNPNHKRHRLLAELRRQGLIFESTDGDQMRLQLSVKGIHRLQRIEIEELTINNPRTWDKKWRMVMFDIPTRRQESRYLLTSQLRRLGFVMIQRSFWVHPHPCFEVVEKVVVYANVQQFVSVAEISRIDETTTKRLLRHYPGLSA